MSCYLLVLSPSSLPSLLLSSPSALLSPLSFWLPSFVLPLLSFITAIHSCSLLPLFLRSYFPSLLPFCLLSFWLPSFTLPFPFLIPSPPSPSHSLRLLRNYTASPFSSLRHSHNLCSLVLPELVSPHAHLAPSFLTLPGCHSSCHYFHSLCYKPFIPPRFLPNIYLYFLPRHHHHHHSSSLNWFLSSSFPPFQTHPSSLPFHHIPPSFTSPLSFVYFLLYSILHTFYHPLPCLFIIIVSSLLSSSLLPPPPPPTPLCLSTSLYSLIYFPYVYKVSLHHTFHPLIYSTSPYSLSSKQLFVYQITLHHFCHPRRATPLSARQ